MFNFFKIGKKNSLIVGGLLVSISLILGYLQNTFFTSVIMLSPVDALSSRVGSFPTTSFLILVLAAAGIVVLGIVGIIFLIVGLSEKDI